MEAGVAGRQTEAVNSDPEDTGRAWLEKTALHLKYTITEQHDECGCNNNLAMSKWETRVDILQRRWGDWKQECGLSRWASRTAISQAINSKLGYQLTSHAFIRHGFSAYLHRPHWKQVCPIILKGRCQKEQVGWLSWTSNLQGLSRVCYQSWSNYI